MILNILQRLLYVLYIIVVSCITGLLFIVLPIYFIATGKNCVDKFIDWSHNHRPLVG